MPALAIAIVVLALAIGGAAVALVVSQQGSKTVDAAVRTTTVSTTETPTHNEEATISSTDTQGSQASTEQDTAPKPNGVLPPGESEAEMAPEITNTLRDFHEDVVAGNYHGAWELMTERKREQSLAKYGYAGWVRNQATLRPYLDPTGLRIDVRDTTPATGVATVDVTGMGWSKPGSSCTEWSGITWVRYENGSWRYDPGYSTTPQRERDWKSRYEELLGGRC